MADRSSPTPSLRERAEAAYALCAVEPERALPAARDVIQAATDDPAARVLAMRALGLALRLTTGPAEGVKVLREAMAVARRHDLPTLLGEVRVTYAALLADVGRLPAALAECDAAARVLRGLAAGPVHAQRGLILSRAGRSEEALASYARAIPLLRRSGDVGFLCRVYMNRANVFVYTGRLTAAERDLRTGLTLAREHGLHQFVGVLQENLGFLHVRRGDIPTALNFLAAALGATENHVRFGAMHDRAEALLDAGLATEALRSLQSGLDEVVAAGFVMDVAEWRLLMAHAALLAGDPEEAAQAAADARKQFVKQARPRWSVLATHLEIRARWAQGERSASLARAARDAHAKLWTAGWQVAALHCLLVAGRVELVRGRLHAARGDLAQAARAKRQGPADLRAAAWYAEALLRLAGDDIRGGLTALKAGLRVVDEHAATLGATDLRVHAAGLGSDLAHQGVRLAVEAGKPGAVLDWTERFRASALRRRPVRPPSDTRLAADLAELRRVTAELADATAAGKDSRTLRAEQVELEESVRQRSRHAKGRGAPAPGLDVEQLLAALGDRALVEMVRVDDALFAVTATGGRLRLHRLGTYSQALAELESLRFSLHRLARRHGSAASLAAAATALEHAAGRLDAVVMAPLLDALGDREVVIVPTGRLHALPWPTLPSCRGRPLAVAPSATTWIAATVTGGRARAGGRIVLVGGPGLDHADAEIRTLATLHPRPQVLLGGNAGAETVRAAMDGAELVHVAAHGRFRADNPQFSALDLADGPLTVYDLERVRRAPRRLVLSACDSGLSAVHPGDELMGLAAAVFSLGTATLIASVVPVADDVTEALMVDLHRALAAGASPATALAGAQENVRADGFVCFGAT